jgi:hypothetical protein
MARASRELRRRVRRWVTVHTHDSTFAGLMAASDDRVVVLVNAQTQTPNGPVDLDGEVILAWSSIDFVQFTERP